MALCRPTGLLKRASRATSISAVTSGVKRRAGWPVRASPSPPGARTPWKVNPIGQTLIVTSGVGWAQCEGEDIVEIRAGDFIWFPPGQRHWEGATPDHAMTYVAIQEEDGRIVEFREKVTDEEYRKGPPAASSRR